jgi:16S rRNA (cytidine1402-2'-O)-methyltransferase
MHTLYVVATPIGNLGDLSPRAIQTLRDVRLIAAEDTRHSRRLLTHFEIDTRLVSYHEHNARERRDQLLAALEEGDIALISDAGTPAISDPGADLVSAAMGAGHRVSPIPGPSALAAAVSASGLIDGSFLSLGFLPRETGERRRAIARAVASGFPLVLFESAQRLKRTLEELGRAMGDRRAVVLREMTKMHEEVRAGTLSELGNWAAAGAVRGEVAIVVGEASEPLASEREAEAVVRALRQSGLSASQAAREAAAMTGLPRSELYAMAMRVGTAPSGGLERELALTDEDTLQEALGDEEGPQR